MSSSDLPAPAFPGTTCPFTGRIAYSIESVAIKLISTILVSRLMERSSALMTDCACPWIDAQ
jgi:hypothetical protein